MPQGHAEIIRECSSTLAIIDKHGRAQTGLTEEQYWRDVIHRHAHRFIEQRPGTVVAYRCSSRTTQVKLP